ncbi:MAG: cation diffusion facilitator family transporter [Anaerovoracaceae bacterium]
MGKLLIKIFIKNYENVTDIKVRERYGLLASLVGIITNSILSAFKIALGLIVNSIAIVADGVNNLADASSSVLTFVGFKMASKPADEEHPYGHARIEYIMGLLVSFIIIIVGLQLIRSSIEKILNPDPLEFNAISIVILLLAIGLKLWQALFNFKISKDINSSALKATGTDSRNDAISTGVVLMGIIIGRITGIQLDGYLGALVALFIIYSGIQLIGETSSPLLGNAPDPSLVDEIKRRIVSEEGVLGVHDLVVHNYGPGRIFASVHIEVDAYGDLIQSHDIIDNIERDISEELNIHLVVHMDPLDTKDPLTQQLNEQIENILSTMDGVIGMHDLRVVAGYSHHNVIFDVVIPPGSTIQKKDIIKKIREELTLPENEFYFVVTLDKSYDHNNVQ